VPGPRLQPALKIGYGVAEVGLNIYVAATALLLFAMLTTVFAVPPGWAGLCLALSKFWDVVTDPAMGWLSDRWRSPTWSRRPFLLAGAVLFSLTFAGLFTVPAFDDWSGSLAYVTVAFMLCATGFTIYAIPYLALAVELTSDYDERTSLTAYRMVFASVGLLLGGALGGLLVSAGGGGRSGYAFMGQVLGAVALFPLLSAFFATRGVATAPSRAPGPADLFSPFRSEAFRILWTTFFLHNLATGTVMSILPIAAAYLLESEDAPATFALLFGTLTLSSIAAAPFWVWISARVDKLRAYRWGGLAFSCALATLFAMGPGRWGLVFALVVLCGFAMSSFQVLPWSMLPDVVDASVATHGEGCAGAFSGLWTAGQKTALALGPLIAGGVLAAAGFAESSAGATVEQSASALSALRWLVSIVPASIFAVGLVFLSRYPLSRDSHHRFLRSQVPV